MNRIRYQTQVEIQVTTADFYFSLESRPLLVVVDGPVYLWKSLTPHGPGVAA
jgi:hypothetical protein